MKNKVLKSFGIVVVVTIFSKILGFVRDALVSYVYGASAITDAFNIVQFLPNFLFMVVQQSVFVGFIPVFLSIFSEHGKEKANGFVNTSILYLTIVSSLICLLLFFFPDFFIRLFASGFSDETAALAVEMLQYGSWSLLLQSIVLLLSSYLNSLKKFLAPACLGFLMDISVIAVLFLSRGLERPSLLGVAPVITMLLQSIALVIVAHREGFKFGKINFAYSKDFLTMLKIALPSILALGISQLNYFVDKNISSNYSEGAISALSLSNNIVNAIEGIIVTSLATVLFTEFSKLNAFGNQDKALNLMSATFDKILLFLIPLSIFVFTCSEPMVRVLYGHGSFSEENIFTTSKCLSFYALGMPFFGLSTVISRYFYSLKKAKYVVAGSMAGLLTNVVGDLLVWNFLDSGVEALALVTSISFVVNCVVMTALLFKSSPQFPSLNISPYVCLYAASLVSAFCASLSISAIPVIAWGMVNGVVCALVFSTTLLIFVLPILKTFSPETYGALARKCISLLPKKRSKNT